MPRKATYLLLEVIGEMSRTEAFTDRGRAVLFHLTAGTGTEEIQNIFTVMLGFNDPDTEKVMFLLQQSLIYSTSLESSLINLILFGSRVLRRLLLELSLNIET